MSYYKPNSSYKAKEIANHGWYVESNSDGKFTWEDIRLACTVSNAERLIEIAQSLESIRHFFHNLGDIRLIVKEQEQRHRNMRRKRLARRRKAATKKGSTKP